MTSAGDHIVWPAYGAVSAAKAALESHIRQLAVELAPHRISVNALRAGVTDTPALRKIPGNEQMIERVLSMHPAGRLTTPADVAGALVALCSDGAAWVSVTTLRGRTCLRAGVVNYLSSTAEIDGLIDALRRLSEGVLEDLDHR